MSVPPDRVEANDAWQLWSPTERGDEPSSPLAIERMNVNSVPPAAPFIATAGETSLAVLAPPPAIAIVGSAGVIASEKLAVTVKLSCR